jgi:hypothetical protein
MTLAFILSMPNRASWNGRWSGENDIYAIVKSFPGKKRGAHAANLVAQRFFSYDFGDGWRASVEVRSVNGTESRQLRKRSKGFCGYNWMVDSIIQDGAIYGPTQPKPQQEATA